MTDWTGLAFVSAFAAALASLIAIGLLLQQSARLRRLEADTRTRSLHDRAMEIDRFFADRPELRPYFYANRPVPRRRRDERARLLSAAAMLVDDFEGVWTQRSRLPRPVFRQRAEGFSRMVAASPVLREYLAEHAPSRPSPPRFLKYVQSQTSAPSRTR